MFVYLLWVLWDIVVVSVEVVWLIFSLCKFSFMFVCYLLELEELLVIIIFVSIILLILGIVIVDVSDDNRMLLVYVFDVESGDDVINVICF